MRTRVVQLFLVNALSCGLEICLSTGTIYMPPLLLEAGMEEHLMTMVLALGPVLGLMFVPIIGNTSDQWSGRFGRRRPFIWALSLGILLSLWLIPHSAHLAALLAPSPRFLEVLLLVVGISMLEFCGQACFTPLEALLSDLFPSEEESRLAFSVYALMVSLGGCVGFLLPAVDWNSRPLAHYMGGQEAFIYTLLSLIFLLCLLTTAFVSEERGGGQVSKRPSAGPPTKSGAYCFLRPPLPRINQLRLVLGGCLTALPRLYRAYRQVPLVIWRLFMAEVCSWMALMTFLLFYTDFVGEGLYQGVPTAAPGSTERLRYDEGIRMGSLGLFLQCSTSVVFSLLMDRLVQSLGMKTVYLSSIAVLALATLVMSVSRCLPLVTLMAAATGYTFSTLQILPYTLICLYHADMPVFFGNSNSQISEDQEKVEKALMLPPGGIKQHCSNGHPGGKPGSASSAPGLAAAPTLGIYVSLPLDGALLPPHGPPEVARGMGLDMAILDSAYLLSHLLPSLVLGYVVQFTRSVAAYMACASVFSLLAIYISSRVIFDRADLERHRVRPAQAYKGTLDVRT
ncbi:hypothetical protein COCON_G00177290 [Conger conger]|uniref:Solute carrier family 45 member 3 n=1 Tax=Conger conger TaxID=82655 RepID=A0A9Q1HS75_CONCO|nr:solute carrier family 45 member 3 [Conger conger]XP_061076727.1 solute carrier family 45 member 3 [Conger conger]KAJ8258717.1 hypothetical protein COCON_G00177290 [Conger conger]